MPRVRAGKKHLGRLRCYKGIFTFSRYKNNYAIMRRRKLFTLVCALCAAVVLSMTLPACGTIHSHWGVEHEYDFPDGGHHHYKHKKHKHKKHKKHHKHHHHDDDDDDDD